MLLLRTPYSSSLYLKPCKLHQTNNLTSSSQPCSCSHDQRSILTTIFCAGPRCRPRRRHVRHAPYFPGRPQNRSLLRGRAQGSRGEKLCSNFAPPPLPTRASLRTDLNQLAELPRSMRLRILRSIALPPPHPQIHGPNRRPRAPDARKPKGRPVHLGRHL